MDAIKTVLLFNSDSIKIQAYQLVNNKYKIDYIAKQFEIAYSRLILTIKNQC